MSLQAVQIAEIVLPLVTVPFLARRLEPAGWGLVVFAQAFAGWMAVMLEYGFTLSATRSIARNRHDKHAVATAVSGVIGAVGLLAVASTLPVIAAFLTVPNFRRDPLLLLLAWAIAIVQGLRPLWYFQGCERLREPAFLMLAVRALLTIAILSLVHDVDDGWKVLVLQLGGSLVVASLMFTWMYRDVPFIRPDARSAWRALQEGWTLFVFRGAVSLYTTVNAFLLGMLAPPAAVAYFGGAERLHRAVASGLDPISQSLYPHVSYLVSSDRARAALVARAGLVVAGVVGVVLALIVIVAAPAAVRLILGPRYEEAVPILRVLALTIPLVAMSNILGIQWMLPLGMDRSFNTVILGAGVVNIALAIWLVPLWGPLGMASAAVAAEAVVTFLMWAVLESSGRQFWKAARVQ